MKREKKNYSSGYYADGSPGMWCSKPCYDSCVSWQVVPLEQVCSDCGVSRDGSKASSIAKAGRSYGLEVKAHRYGVDEVKENVTYPAIIHWNLIILLCYAVLPKMQL